MKTKTKSKYSENFLNNQNYILWKTEKKKLLSKFFVEKFFKNILTFLPLLNWILYSFIWIFIILSIPLFFVDYAVIESTNALISFLFSMFLLLVLWFSLIVWWIKSFRLWYYERIRDYFITIKPNKLNNSIWAVLVVFSPLFIFEWWHVFFDGYWFINVIVSVVLAFYLSRKNFLNIMSIVFFPVVLIFSCLNFLITIFMVFVFRWINKYTFKKNNPKINILKKFNILEMNFAQNNFIELKQK